MPRLSVLNMLIGFSLIFFAAAGGPFLAFDATDAFIHDPTIISSWLFTLLSSAHGHTNLFGMLHVLFALSMPYSTLSPRVKKLQTVGFGLGSFGMSVLMVIRANMGPVAGYDLLGLFTGVCLSAALAAIGVHCYGLAMKWARL